MNRFFNQDTVVVGIIVALGSELLLAALLTVGLLLAGEAPAAHLRWYAAAFLPPLLLLRHYAKKTAHMRVVRTIIVVLFVTFMAYMYFYLKAVSG